MHFSLQNNTLFDVTMKLKGACQVQSLRQENIQFVDTPLLIGDATGHHLSPLDNDKNAVGVEINWHQIKNTCTKNNARGMFATTHGTVTHGDRMFPLSGSQLPNKEHPKSSRNIASQSDQKRKLSQSRLTNKEQSQATDKKHHKKPRNESASDNLHSLAHIVSNAGLAFCQLTVVASIASVPTSLFASELILVVASRASAVLRRIACRGAAAQHLMALRGHLRWTAVEAVATGFVAVTVSGRKRKKNLQNTEEEKKFWGHDTNAKLRVKRYCNY